MESNFSVSLSQPKLISICSTNISLDLINSENDFSPQNLTHTQFEMDYLHEELP